MEKQGLMAQLASKKKLLLGTILLVAVSGFAYKRYMYKAPEQAPLAARVQVAKASYIKGLELGTNSTTSLKAIRDVEIKAKVEAPVQKIYIKRNDRVQQGQLLVELEHDSASAQLAMNRAAADAAKWKADNAQVEQARYDKLVADGVVSRSEVDSKRTTYGTAAADYEQSMAAIKYAQATINDCLVRAPFDGVVLDDYDVTVGSKLKVDSTMLRMADISQMKCSVMLPEAQLSAVQEGMEAKVECTSFNGESFIGKVATINSFVDSTTHTFRVDVLIDNAALGYKLCPGMFAKVSILPEQAKEKALTIPKEAVREDGSVFVVQDKKVEQRQIKTGASDSKNIVVASGLSEGELVVISGGKTLKNGDAVDYSQE
ncbi:MAG: efflux RND transporter periplasmic adaptor subunit [Phascolarctobacterium sp.]